SPGPRRRAVDARQCRGREFRPDIKPAFAQGIDTMRHTRLTALGLIVGGFALLAGAGSASAAAIPAAGLAPLSDLAADTSRALPVAHRHYHGRRIIRPRVTTRRYSGPRTTRRPRTTQRYRYN